MGKVLMVVGFFVALLAMGQMVVESDFGIKPSGFFTPSTYLLIFAFTLFVIGEILERRGKWALRASSQAAGTSFQRGLQKSALIVSARLSNLKALFLLMKIRAKRY